MRDVLSGRSKGVGCASKAALWTIGTTRRPDCPDASLAVRSSDKLHVGGPGKIHGFLPACVGPRTNGGDALCGDLFYALTQAASAPFLPYFSTLRQNEARLFGFPNA